VFGNGLEGFPELRRIVLTQYQSEPSERTFTDISSLMKVVNNRPVIDESK
jgi:hypothetical protein